MAQSSRIKTPFKQHLHRFRLGALPVISFIGCVMLTLWLWNRQVTVGSLLGEIEATSVTVVAGATGQLLPRQDQTYVQRHDNVRKGDLLARLDDSELQARLETVTQTIKRLEVDVEAARSNFLLNVLNLDQDEAREKARLELEVLRLKIAGMQQQAVVKELKREAEGVESMLKLPIDRLQVIQRRNQLATLQARLEAEQQVLREYADQYKQARDKADVYSEIDVPEVETVLNPIRAEIDVQRALMNEINTLTGKLSITAPIDGVISAVLKVPGQEVMAGDGIVTIVSPDSQFIVSYIRESQRVPLIEGMEVGLRLRDEPGEEYQARVQRVGPHVQPVPPHQLTDQATPEWGSPIFIPIPPKLQQQPDRIRPGQLLQVIIKRPRQRR